MLFLDGGVEAWVAEQNSHRYRENSMETPPGDRTCDLLAVSSFDLIHLLNWNWLNNQVKYYFENH